VITVTYADKRLEQQCTERARGVRDLGSERFKRLQRRMLQLKTAASMADLVGTGQPGRWHLLKADLAGGISADLDGPYRLIMEPADDVSGELSSCTTVLITSIDDTH